MSDIRPTINDGSPIYINLYISNVNTTIYAPQKITLNAHIKKSRIRN